MPEPSEPAIIALGFDYGLKRIGIAAGDTLTGSARPIGTISSHDGAPDWSTIDRYVRDWGPSVFVVGVPYNMDDSPTALTESAMAFGDALSKRFGRQVEPVDERLSSREAEDQLRQRRANGERSRRVGRGDIDAVAAAVLLEQWLRERNRMTRT